jgi:hypothetical protein
MDGRAGINPYPEYQTPLDDVLYQYGLDGTGSTATVPALTFTTLRPGTSETGETGPEVAFAHYLNNQSNDSIAIIKYANGGTGFANTRWRAGGDATTTGDDNGYLRLQNTVTAGLANMQSAQPSETFTIGGILWTQGELDARQMMSTNDYAAHLTTLITDMRATWGTDLPFFFSRLSSGQTDLPGADLANIRAAQDQVNANVSNTHLIDTDGFSLSNDDLHFNAVGLNSLGQAYGQAAIDAGVVSAIPEPSSAMLLLLGGGTLYLTRRKLTAPPPQN